MAAAFIKDLVSCLQMPAMLWLLVFTTAALADVPLSTRMIMVTSDHCPWCEAFEEEVGQFYHLTPEARVYPMLRVEVDDQFPAEFDGITPAFFTPTFIFVENGKERGRIEGYPGQELFWWRMGEFLPR